MKVISNLPEYIISYDPLFLIIEDETNKKGLNYVFYNSAKHIAGRLNKLELLLLDLLYQYDDIDYICGKFPSNKYEVIKCALNFIQQNALLSHEELEVPIRTPMIPSAYYFHLTYKCNLKCTYCYNKEVRGTLKKELSIEEWYKIIDKISPFAKAITLTGGEFLLFQHSLELVKYIKYKIPNVQLSCISNGMHDIKNPILLEVLKYIDEITFSCDSINEAGERVGFVPEKFKQNIITIRQLYPKLGVSISATHTYRNTDDLDSISEFCREQKCHLRKVTLIPGHIEEIELMPDMDSIIKNMTLSYDS